MYIVSEYDLVNVTDTEILKLRGKEYMWHISKQAAFSSSVIE